MLVFIIYCHIDRFDLNLNREHRVRKMAIRSGRGVSEQAERRRSLLRFKANILRLILITSML